MAIIRSLFDSKRALNRPIEKVITYQAASEAQLKAEVSEYEVTKHIEESFDYLLKLMQAALQGGLHEVGVWVSGFYGSGKSSFTKYLGFALDRRKMVDGDPFLRRLQDRITSAPVRALFNTVSTIYDPEVIFLDLASEMLAEASMADISTVLYRKVLQWAGYSEDIKIAELERMLEKDNKLTAFQKRAQAEADGEPWDQVHNQPLVANAIASRLACQFYPNLFKTEESFSNLSIDLAKSEIKRAEEMLELVFRKSGKKNVFFIIDEVGQYVSAKPNLITNLDGLAKNIKQIGGGHAWIFATAQQTLTEDNPSAIINAPGLFKLKDRFPIQIHLEASDIKEICHKRLLTKSASGEEALGKQFDTHGSSLRTATQLKDAGVYEQPLDRAAFVDLYPFLPAHFEILLQLLGRLARKTGGLGLRSAIKVLQDVLLDRGGRPSGEPALADAEVGTLANTVTFYDSLRHDLQSSYAHIVEGVTKVSNRFPGKKLHLDVAKSIAILQILENLPVTAHNIAALLHPDVKAQSLGDKVHLVIQELLKDGFIPLGEKNGSLRFLTQAAVTLQKEFDLIEYRNADVRSELNRALASLFQPLPSARLAGVRPVTAGLRVGIGGGQSVSLEGDKESIQLTVEFTAASAYDQTRKDREDDSRAASQRTSIFLLGRTDPEADKLAVTLVRCGKFVDQHKNATDPETQEFVRIVAERAERTTRELETRLKNALQAGSFVAHGAHRPVSELAPDLADAAKIFLADAAAKIFDRYAEAPVQAGSGLAENFLVTPLDHVFTKVTSIDEVQRLKAVALAQIETNESEADLIISRLVGLSSEDRSFIEAHITPRWNGRRPSNWFSPRRCDGVSYFLGCAFGRWDIRYATGEKPTPDLQDPFAPLPVCPAGMLQNPEGLPARAQDVPATYPISIPWNGILADDCDNIGISTHTLDIELRVRKVIEAIWGDRAEAIEHDACQILAVKSLRDHFRKPAGFFADHLKRYSKSRRQAPIYWPLSTASGNYTLWLYYHRLSDQTLHTALADFVDPKIKSVERDIEVLIERAGGGGSQVGESQEFLDELRGFRAEIERIIKLPWKPNLNDGVLITASPLWKLFRLPKWRKDLEACWRELERGDYDWAHLAYTIWPDRVKEKCKADRSLAIAHGLETICQIQPPEKKAKKNKTKTVEENPKLLED